MSEQEADQIQIIERLEVLETKLSYQDHLIEELNQVIIGQQSELEQVKSLVESLREMLDVAAEQAKTHS